jgi:streptogramin lyase
LVLGLGAVAALVAGAGLSLLFPVTPVADVARRSSGAAWFAAPGAGAAVRVDLAGRSTSRVDLGLTGPPVAVAQAREGVVALDATGALVRVDGVTGERRRVEVPARPDARVAVDGAGTVAWVVSPAAGTARPYDAATLEPRAGDQALPAGTAADGVAAGTDGRLWALGAAGDLRELQPGRVAETGSVPGWVAGRLVLVDDRPVVVDRERPRVLALDRVTGALERELPWDPPRGDLALAGAPGGGWLVATAAGSRMVAAVNVVDGRRRVLFPSPAAGAVLGAPVAHAGRFFVPVRAAGGASVAVLDPERPELDRPVASVAVPVEDPVLRAVDGALWYHDRTTGRVGVIGPDLTAGPALTLP